MNFGVGKPSFVQQQPQASAAPTFGGFGTASTTTSAFNFGSTAARTTAPTFGFGTTPSFSNPASSFNTGFSFGTGLGATTSTTAFGSTTNTFSFSNPTTTATGFSFPSTGLGATQPTFSFGGTAAAPAFGATAPSFSMFNTGSAAPAPMGAPTQQAATHQLATAVSVPNLFGDERDAIIAQWNQLQAFWGIGKGYYALNNPPLDFTPDNPLCRFKCVGYSKNPQYNPEDGLVGLDFNKSDTEIVNQKQQLIESLHRIFGSRPNLTVCIEGIKTMYNNHVEVIIYLVEKLQTGMNHRIASSDVLNHLQQASVKPQLAQLGIENVVPKTCLSKEFLQVYLDTPQSGIDPILWKQAKLDNPDPQKFIPVPIIGFDGLLKRLKCQQQETVQHQERLRLIGETISQLKQKQTTMAAKISETKRKQLELGQRLLKVMVRQEITRKVGFALQPDEEKIQNQLESVQAQLDSPTQYRGRLKELLSQIRLHNHRVALKGENERYKLSPNLYPDIKQHLQNQSEGINYLINIIKEDIKVMESITNYFKGNADKTRQ